MACTTLVTLADAEQAKLVAVDLQALVYSTQDTFSDLDFETRYTLTGIKNLVEAI